jgi:hypothetical protein
MDVIVTSSARDTIFSTIDSFLENVQFSGRFRFNINVDCRNDHSPEKIESLFRKLNTGYYKVNNPPLGFTRAVSSLINKVETKYYFHLEDDWLFLQKVDLDKMISFLDKHPEINHIRFSKEKILYYDELFYLRKLKFIPVGYDGFRTKNIVIDKICLVETMNYSANPNISRTKHFQNMPYVNSLDLEQQFALQSFLKKTIFGIKSGYYIYGQIGDDATVKHIG